MIAISFNLITGLCFGLEQDTGDEDEEYSWLVALHLGIFRIIFLKLK